MAPVAAVQKNLKALLPGAYVVLVGGSVERRLLRVSSRFAPWEKGATEGPRVQEPGLPV